MSRHLNLKGIAFDGAAEACASISRASQATVVAWLTAFFFHVEVPSLLTISALLGSLALSAVLNWTLGASSGFGVPKSAFFANRASFFRALHALWWAGSTGTILGAMIPDFTALAVDLTSIAAAVHTVLDFRHTCRATPPFKIELRCTDDTLPVIVHCTAVFDFQSFTLFAAVAECETFTAYRAFFCVSEAQIAIFGAFFAFSPNKPEALSANPTYSIADAFDTVLFTYTVVAVFDLARFALYRLAGKARFGRVELLFTEVAVTGRTTLCTSMSAAAFDAFHLHVEHEPFEEAPTLRHLRAVALCTAGSTSMTLALTEVEALFAK